MGFCFCFLGVGGQLHPTACGILVSQPGIEPISCCQYLAILKDAWSRLSIETGNVLNSQHSPWHQSITSHTAQLHSNPIWKSPQLWKPLKLLPYNFVSDGKLFSRTRPGGKWGEKARPVFISFDKWALIFSWQFLLLTDPSASVLITWTSVLIIVLKFRWILHHK